MSMTPTRKSKKNKVATSEVGAGTQYHHPKGKSGRKNVKPEPIVDK